VFKLHVRIRGGGCAVTVPSSKEDAPSIYPERVGRYELLLPIGTGGMATVHLARTAVVGDLYREVALKLMHPHFRAEDGEWATHLLDEAKLAARIRHPNVVSVLEVGEGDFGVFLVMEYVEGDTLSGLVRAARARGQALPLAIAGRILVDALAGLHAAHELTDEQGARLDLVHRDFSPQNILVGTDGISRLTDFGIAKSAARVGVTSSGIIKGKVGYMAPEQALGKRVDRRCDVWAAGVVCWELLAGQRLYKQEDQVTTLLRIVQEVPPRLRSVRPDVPVALEQLVAQALTMNPEQRIGSASELRKRLIETWRNEVELADTTEVGEAVRELARPKLEKRRAQVGEVLRLRQKMATLSRSAAKTAAQDAGTPSFQAPDGEPRAEPTSGITSPSEIAALHSVPALRGSLAPPRHRRLVTLAAASVGLLVAVLAVWAVRASGTSADPGAAAAATVATAVGDPPPVASAAPAPPPAAQPKPGNPLGVRANAPIAKLSIGGKTVPVEKPTRTLDATLPPGAREGDLAIEAVAVDGRRVTVTVAGDTEKLELTFPPPVPLAPAKRPVRHSPPKRPEPPGLAPTPYGNP
jgi:serine/threonine-protein kinase